MIKLTVLALFVALQQGSSAEKETQRGSRRLLQYPYYNPNPGYVDPYYNPGYPQQQPSFNCDPCDPWGTCSDMYACWDQIQRQGAQQQPAAPAPPANSVPVTPVAVDPVPPVPAAPVNNPPASNPPPAVVTPPANNAPINPPLGGPQVQPLPNPGQYPPQMGPPQMGPPQQPGPGGLYPAPGAMPFIPGLMPAMTDINCGPPPAMNCANRNNGPTGAVDPFTGLKLGPLELGPGLANNAKLYCDTPGICAGSEINMNFGPGQGIRAINQLLFSEPGSGTGSTVNIKNMQGLGNNIELSNLECGTGACGGLTINGWGVSLNDVNCAVAADCMGCTWRNMKTTPDMFCPNPFAPNAPNMPGCVIEQMPCYGY